MTRRALLHWSSTDMLFCHVQPPMRIGVPTVSLELRLSLRSVSSRPGPTGIVLPAMLFCSELVKLIVGDQVMAPDTRIGRGVNATVGSDIVTCGLSSDCDRLPPRFSDPQGKVRW